MNGLIGAKVWLDFGFTASSIRNDCSMNIGINLYDIQERCGCGKPLNTKDSPPPTDKEVYVISSSSWCPNWLLSTRKAPSSVPHNSHPTILLQCLYHLAGSQQADEEDQTIESPPHNPSCLETPTTLSSSPPSSYQFSTISVPRSSPRQP